MLEGEGNQDWDTMTELQGWIIIGLLACVLLSQWRIAVWDHRIRDLEWEERNRISN